MDSDSPGLFPQEASAGPIQPRKTSTRVTWITRRARPNGGTDASSPGKEDGQARGGGQLGRPRERQRAGPEAGPISDRDTDPAGTVRTTADGYDVTRATVLRVASHGRRLAG